MRARGRRREGAPPPPRSFHPSARLNTISTRILRRAVRAASIYRTMTVLEVRRRIVVLAVVAASTLCATAAHAQRTSAPGQLTASDLAAMAKAKRDSVNRPYTKPDIDFMRGMIAHHAQALVMAGWAP